jgi:hypothetical protein
LKFFYNVTIVFLFILIPIDWFEYTGSAFRELGAKPAIIYIILLATLVLCKHILGNKGVPVDKLTVIVFLCIFIFGVSTFSFNILVFGQGKNFAYYKQPDTQFFSQGLMFLSSVYSLIFLNGYFSKGLISIRKCIRFSSVIHLLFFALEYAEILNDKSGFLLNFRSDGGVIERATGLMSEPSYYGVMAGLFGGALIFTSKKKLDYIIVILLFTTAALISAKTMFVVLLAQFIMSAILIKNFLTYSKLVVLFFIMTAGLIVIINNNALNLQENMSSAMRIGSTLLAINAAFDGYGIMGVGFGQFHYLYLAEYAPSFLMYSDEAANQFNINSPNRASSFNFFARYLIELGVFSLVIFLIYILKIMRKAVINGGESSKVGFHFIAGSLGFLMTQDTYFYPPLIIGIALVLSEKNIIKDTLGKY